MTHIMFEVLTNIGDLDTFVNAAVASSGIYSELVLFLGVIFGGEAVILVALLLTQQGVLDLVNVFLISIAGTICADIFWFFVGRYFPERCTPRFFSGSVCKNIYSFVQFFVRDRFFLSILLLKFFIGARLAIILYISRQTITFKRFLTYDALGTIIYMTVLSGIGVLFGKFLHTLIPSHGIIGSILLGIFLVLFISLAERRSISKLSGKE